MNSAARRQRGNGNRYTGSSRPTRKISVPSLVSYVEKRLGSSLAPANLGALEGKLLCSPKQAAHTLDCGITKLYELLNSRQIESFVETKVSSRGAA